MQINLSILNNIPEDKTIWAYLVILSLALCFAGLSGGFQQMSFNKEIELDKNYIKAIKTEVIRL